MAIGLVMTFEGLTVDAYEGVMAASGLDLHTPRNPDAKDDWPDGVVSHVAGPTPTGWCVVDIWTSQEKFDAFMDSRLGPTMAKVGVPEPTVIRFDVYNSHTE